MEPLDKAFSILGKLLYLIFIVILLRCYNLLAKNIVKIHLNLKIKLFPDNRRVLYKGDVVVDNIKVAQRRLLMWFIIGDRGYYLIHRITGKITTFDEYNMIPCGYKKVFDEMLL